MACLSFPAVFSGLLDLLAPDHRVVTYDLRGTGDSDPGGPFDLETDAADLEALVEAVGCPALVLALGDGCNRAVRVAARRPELVSAVVTPGGGPLGRERLARSEGLAASTSVVNALVEMMRTDYRAALRTTAASTNPQMGEDDVRARVDAMVRYSPQDATLARLVAWIEDAPDEEARALGGRLHILHHPHNPWFPLDVVDGFRAALPEARIEVVEDGPLSRPDIVADAIRALTHG